MGGGMTHIERLEALRDDYLSRLEDHQPVHGMNWPQSEQFLRGEIEALCDLIARERQRGADGADGDVEWVSQAVT